MTEVPEIKVDILPGPMDGTAVIHFNQRMLTPRNFTNTNYTEIFEVSLRSRIDYSMIVGDTEVKHYSSNYTDDGWVNSTANSTVNDTSRNLQEAE